MIGQVLRLVIGHLPLVLEILLVADEDAGDIFLGVLVDLAHPL